VWLSGWANKKKHFGSEHFSVRVHHRVLTQFQPLCKRPDYLDPDKSALAALAFASIAPVKLASCALAFVITTPDILAPTNRTPSSVESLRSATVTREPAGPGARECYFHDGQRIGGIGFVASIGSSNPFGPTLRSFCFGLAGQHHVWAKAN
jgi:hypothetical protein